MLRDRELARNTALLTASGLFMRFVGMLWQIWLVGRIGEAGIGLYQLVLSVGALAATVAVSGSRYTATRLVSEELGVGAKDGAARALTVCLFYGLFFGLAAGTALLFLSEPAGFLWLEDARTVRPLLLLALEMPLTGLDSVLHGYFTAVGRVWKSVCVSIGQQLLTIALTAGLILSAQPGNLEAACRSVTAGRVLGAGAELIALAVIFAFDRRAHSICRGKNREPLSGMTDRALRLALPLAAASYARSGLSTLQHLLVPRGLKASGLASEAALAGYGVVQGMALPVVLFPSCLMLAAAELIVPKLTRAQVQKNDAAIRETSEGLLRPGLRFAAFCAAIFFALGDLFGTALFGSEAAGRYIRLFAVIVPVMYLDMLADGCLKGLGQMFFCMVVNIADAGLSALMVWLLLPKRGLAAYLFTICFTEVFNFILSLGRLRRVSGLRLRSLDVPRSLLLASVCGGISYAASKIIRSAGNGVPALILSVSAALAVYIPFAVRPGEGEPAGAGRQASE